MEGCYTKDEIISIVLDKLNPSKDEIFVDIGCGTGRVSLKASKVFKKVFAVDVDDKAVKNFKARVEDLGIGNIEVVHSHGKKFLASAEKIDKIFFGGTKDIEDMLDIAVKKSKMFAVNLARMDNAVRVTAKMKDLGVFKEILLINISKGYDLAGGVAFKPYNPIFIVTGEVRS